MADMVEVMAISEDMEVVEEDPLLIICMEDSLIIYMEVVEEVDTD